jgi:hypothetical protein
MKVIDVQFERLSEIPLGDVLGQIGVYVLWDRLAKARPSYIGEGNILKRLVEHVKRFALPLDGYVAPLAAPTPQRAKADAEIVEALLMEVAYHMDRRPSVNVAPGKLRGLDDIFRLHGTLRVNVRGFDPLSPPKGARPIGGSKRIVLCDFADGVAFLDHEWRLRRRRKAN